MQHEGTQDYAALHDAQPVRLHIVETVRPADYRPPTAGVLRDAGLRRHPSNLIWIMPAKGDGAMDLIEHACLLRDRVRERAPLVHCITNFVAMDTAANAVLAIGGSPAMMHAREEVAEFAAIAHALTINIGTLTPDWVGSMKVAVGAATKAGKPWVFDPVGVGATSLRRRSA